MGKKLLLAVAIIIFAIGLWYVLVGQNSTTQPTSAGTAAGTATSQPPAQPAEQTSQTQNQPTPMTVTVTYTDNGFSPSTVTIPKGGTVIFKNAASDDVRVASNPHPIHNGYPTTGGCVGSTFDSCSNIPPGGSWSFTFTFVGSWGYHNHLNPSEGGTVAVQ